MSRISLVCLVIAVAGVAVIGTALSYAQVMPLVGPEKVSIIYDGDLAVDSGGIEVMSWGSGTAEPVYEEAYVGPQVLKVTSHGPYQGIVLELNRPADLEEFVSARQGYLDLRVLPAQAKRTEEERERAREQRRLGTRGGGGGGMRGGGGGMRGGGGRGGRGGGMRGGGGGGMRGGGGGMRGGGGGMRGGGGGMRGGGGGMRGGGGGMRGGGRGMRGGGMGGRMARGAGAAQPGAGPVAPGARAGAAAAGEKAFNLRNLRLVLFTDQGMVVADSVPVGQLPRDERAWVPVTVSLSRFRGAEKASTVRAVGVFADESDVFYLGQVRLVVDRTPVTVEAKAEPAVARVDQVIQFTAGLRGGAIEPKISWDFDDSDGIQEEALGAQVKYVYKEPGDYLVTCTATDRTGVRPPATKATGVHIEAKE